MKKILLLFSFISATVLTKAQTWQDTVVAIEKLFIRYRAANPGCQLGITRHGQVIFSKTWGMADLEHNVSPSTESVIEAGSANSILYWSGEIEKETGANTGANLGTDTARNADIKGFQLVPILVPYLVQFS